MTFRDFISTQASRALAWTLTQIPAGDPMTALGEAQQKIRDLTEERDSLAAKLLLALTQGATAVEKERLSTSNPYPENSDTSLFWLVGFTSQCDSRRLRRERDDFQRQLASRDEAFNKLKSVTVELLEMQLPHGGCCMCGRIATTMESGEPLCQDHSTHGNGLSNADIVARARSLVGLDKPSA